jgi:hypothetical protein
LRHAASVFETGYDCLSAVDGWLLQAEIENNAKKNRSALIIFSFKVRIGIVRSQINLNL